MIPNNIILTYKNDNIPSYVFSNIKRLNPDKEILFFTDEDVVKFLSKEYGSSHVDFFHSIKLGCIKADFFRYCYLWKYGGYYSDVDIEHVVPISSYIQKNIEFFSVNSGACKNTTFQALLFCEPNHPIINDCILDLMNPQSATNTFYFATGHMYKNIRNFLSIDEIMPGDYTKGNKTVRIGQEIPINNRWCCISKSLLIAFSRYETYKKKSPGTNQEIGFFT
jgi:mannosyltransferase OCH1-like enzyme